jgi:hypothetical protein
VSKYIVDDIGKVVTAMNEVIMPVYYMYGHRLEINNRLLAASKDVEKQYKKYPLVALRLDIPETNSAGMVYFSLNIAILANTEKNYNAEDRYDKVFKPVLYPLYELFLNRFRQAGLFIFKDSIPQHTKIDRPYWGTTQKEGNVANILSDPLDAIELVDLKFSKTLNNCK